MKKIAFFGFTGELMCFAHALFNADEMITNGWDVKVILEGQSTGLIPVLDDEKNPFRNLYVKLRDMPDTVSVCQACANKTGTLENAKSQNLKLENNLLGHPSFKEYIDKGYQIVTI